MSRYAFAFKAYYRVFKHEPKLYLDNLGSNEYKEIVIKRGYDVVEELIMLNNDVSSQLLAGWQ